LSPNDHKVNIGPDPISTYDIKLAKKSLENLMNYDIQNIICYHGGLYNGNCNKRIAELVEK
jgi:hypothetical protein